MKGWLQKQKGSAKRRGFTLLELLMVVVIIGILASLAVPQYIKAAERARMAEAISLLGQTWNSQLRFRAENGTFTSTLTQLDFDPSSAEDVAGSRLFAYTCPTADATNLVCDAVRQGFGGAGGCVASYRLSIDANGAFTGRDCQQT